MRLSADPTIQEYFEHIYWKDAGLKKGNRKENTYSDAI